MPLRLMEEADLPTVLEWRNSPRVRDHMFTRHVISMEEHRAWFESLSEDVSKQWYVHLDAHDRMDGVVGFSSIDLEGRSASWGFYTGNDAAPGTGLALGIDALNEAFGPLHLETLFASVLGDNDRSHNFHRRLGFTEYDCQKDGHTDGDETMDIHLYSIDRETWQERVQDLSGVTTGERS